MAFPKETTPATKAAIPIIIKVTQAQPKPAITPAVPVLIPAVVKLTPIALAIFGKTIIAVPTPAIVVPNICNVFPASS